MCGIVGYTGKRNAAPLIVEGLKCLEYRGYDSFGLAVMESGDGSAGHADAAGKPAVIKKQGRISDAGSEVSAACGNIGIGHVRYSTAGGSTKENAQPIFINYAKGTIALAHNGNITNSLSCFFILHNPVKISTIFVSGYPFGKKVFRFDFTASEGENAEAPSARWENVSFGPP